MAPFTTTMSPDVTTQQNVHFHDHVNHWQYTVDSQPDSTFGTANMNDTPLDKFLGRPIRIASLNWSVGAGNHTDLDPWSLFLANKRVVNRISNFKLLRGTMCIKLTINGNGFYYGRSIMSYIPLASKDTITLNRNTVATDVIAASQRPHIYIDPCTSEGGVLKLPFVWQKNAFDIVSGDWSGTAMGLLNIRSINILQHANGGTEQIGRAHV